MNAIHQKLGFSLAAIATLGCGSAWADPSAAGCGSVSGAQRRIVQRADESMESLRSYVQSTTFVYGIDMQEVKGSLDTWRATVVCQKEVAAAAAAAETAKARTAPVDVVSSAAR